MNDIDAAPSARLWTPEGFREDEWSHSESADALAGNHRVILPLEAFIALDPEQRGALSGRIGVHILPSENIEAIVPYLNTLPLISLGFPAFSDGRSYSKAELLRTRHGYTGTLRASGDVLIDQIPLMVRTGFSEFEVKNPTALKRLEEGRVGGIPFYYQPTAKAEAEGARYAWRRIPAA